MRYSIAMLMFCTMFTVAAGYAQAQQAQFPLAAPAGQDSGARQVAPPGAVNQGPFFDSTWKYGTAFTPPAGAKIWNPAKLKLMQGGKLVGGTVRGVVAPSTYCAMADAGYDFIWTEMQHQGAVGGSVARLANLPARESSSRRARRIHGRARDPAGARRRRARARRADRRYRRRSARGGAVGVLSAARRRSLGGGNAFGPDMWGSVPGGYRNTINDNLVLILMIETLEGLKNADEIAKVPGVTRGVRGQRRPQQLLRLSTGRPGLRARDQHRARRRHQGRQKTLRPVRVERPPGFHVLPGAKRDRANPARRKGGARKSCEHAGETRGWALRTQVNNRDAPLE